jgi:7,8-dihydropterin-6-yl-methyl-4-(beta-D-ribofuranosyl)aminobenzene 5'-phosphate synthase
VVIDSYQFAVAPSAKAGNVDIQHFGWGLGDKPPGKPLVNKFGLAMHIESQHGTETHNVLVDFGYTPEALANNTYLLDIDPAGLDALVLSHGHYSILVAWRASPASMAAPVHGDFGALDRSRWSKQSSP